MSRFIGFGEPGISEERKVLEELVKRKRKLRDKVDQSAGQLAELRSEVSELFSPITTTINKQITTITGPEVKDNPEKLKVQRGEAVVMVDFIKALMDDMNTLNSIPQGNITPEQQLRLNYLKNVPLGQELDFHESTIIFVDARLAFLADPTNPLKASRAAKAEGDLVTANTKMIEEYKKVPPLQPLTVDDSKRRFDDIVAEQRAAAEQQRLADRAARTDIINVWGYEFVVPDFTTSKPFLDVMIQTVSAGYWDNKGMPPERLRTGRGGMYPIKNRAGLFIVWEPYDGNGRAEYRYDRADNVADFNWSGASNELRDGVPLDTKVLLMGLIGFQNPPQHPDLGFTDEDIRDYIYSYTQVFGKWQPQTDGFDNASPLMTAITTSANYAQTVAEAQSAIDENDPASVASLFGQPTYNWGTTEFTKRGNKNAEPITAGLGMKKHPKGKPYRVGPDGQFGDLSIDIPALYNKAIIVATTPDGRKVMDERATLGLVNLLTKRVHKAMKNTYTPQAKKQFAKLVSLSGLEPPVKSKKFKIVQKVQTRKATKGKGCSDDESPDVVVCGDMNDVVKRLHAATGMFDAGNRSKKNCMLITELATKLAEESLITPVQYRRMLVKYVPKSK